MHLQNHDVMKKLTAVLALIINYGLSIINCESSAFAQEDVATFRTWAMTPPMGWNSWDCYYSSVTEDIVLKNAAYMAQHKLNEYGWEYVVVDIRWYCNHPSLGGGWYNQNGTQDYVLDQYGRYLPSPRRFPSAMVDGENKGFKALADSIHAMGLKFGIHMMRGVPTVVAKNPTQYELKGVDCSTDAKRRSAWGLVYNGTTSPCSWLGDNALVRNSNNGQLYYNSLMDLYAEWGVDFVKIDDISRPFYTNEVKMIRKAIDQCGRPIVLSLSPGKTAYSYAQQCLDNANMWRMMDDLWDSWSAVDLVFSEADYWSQHTRPGNYADCDMLPLGQIAMTVADPGYTNADAGRWTNLTHDEQYTMMTLWGICHSPLFFGGEMTRNDKFTLSLLTNRDYLHMHSYAEDCHQVYSDTDKGHVLWTGTDPDTGGRYLALFQRDNTWWQTHSNAVARTGLISRTGLKSKEVEFSIEGAEKLIVFISNYGDGFNYDRADLVNPVLIDADGKETSLTKLSYASYKSEWGSVHVNRNVENGTLKVAGKTYTTGLGLNAECTLIYNLPAGHTYTTFRALCGYDSSCDTDNPSTSGTTMEFMFYLNNIDTDTTPAFDIDLTQFGYAKDEKVAVFNIWTQQYESDAVDTLSVSVPLHGALLYRLEGSGSSVEAASQQVAGYGLQDTETYNLAGRKMANSQQTTVNSLPKGVYITQGKKVLVR